MRAFNRRLRFPLAMFLCLLACAAAASAASPLTEFAIPTAGRNPEEIAAGPDGNLWFTESVPDGGIGMITPSGAVTEFPLAASNNHPGLGPITVGGDGAIWFRSKNFRAIDRMTPDGHVTEMAIPSDPNEMTLGPDGKIWYSSCVSVGRLSSAGVVEEFKLPLPPSKEPIDFCTTDGEAVGITTGADGNIWFAVDGDGSLGDSSRGQIGRITLSGQITLFDAGGYSPRGIAAGPDGNIWFVDRVHDVIGRSTLSGAITTYPANVDALRSITSGPDGNLWFTTDIDLIGRVTPEGEITVISLPAGSGPSGITVGPDQKIWFTEAKSDKIGRLDPTAPGPCFPDAHTLCLGRFRITASWAGLGQSGEGNSASLTANTGYFWFFGPSNVEVFVKILNACPASGKFDVYVNGLTHLGVTVTVTDVDTGTSKSFVNPEGAPFYLLFDGSTFACP